MVKVKSDNQTEQVSAVEPSRSLFLKGAEIFQSAYYVMSNCTNDVDVPDISKIVGVKQVTDNAKSGFVKLCLHLQRAVRNIGPTGAFVVYEDEASVAEPSTRDIALEAIEILKNVRSDDAKLGPLLAKTSAHLESLTLELVGHHERARQQLSESSAFKEASVTDLLVLKRFAERRDTLLEKYDFVDKLALAQFLGFPTGTPADKHNVNRRLNSLREKKKILSVNYRDEAIYPLFQFDESLNWHEALVKRLPDLLDSRSGWDVCFWLDTERSVLVERAVATDQQIEEALAAGPEAYDKLVQAQAEQTVYESHSPLSLLAQKKYDLFDIFCEDLVNPEHRVIAEKPLEARLR